VGASGQGYHALYGGRGEPNPGVFRWMRPSERVAEGALLPEEEAATGAAVLGADEVSYLRARAGHNTG